jgi:uncharacterized protein
MHPDAEVILQGFQAFDEGDMATMRGLFHEGAVWHSAGRSRFAGDFEGVDAILAFFEDISSAATLENELHAILADDEHVVVMTKGSASAGDHRYEGNGFFVFHVEGGKVREAWTASFDQYAEDEFWAKVA